MSQLSATKPAFTARDTVLTGHKKNLFSRTRSRSFSELRPPQHPAGSKSVTKKLFTRSRNPFPLTIYAIKPQQQSEKLVPIERTKKHANANKDELQKLQKQNIYGSYDNLLPRVMPLGSSSLTNFQDASNWQGPQSQGHPLRRNTMSPSGGKKYYLLKKTNSTSSFKLPAQSRCIDKDMMMYTPHPPQSDRPTETNIPHLPQSVRPTETNIPHPPQSVRPTETNIPHLPQSVRPTETNIPHPPQSVRPTETNTGLKPDEYRTELQTQITNCYQIQNININTRLDPLITAMEGDGLDASKPNNNSNDKSVKEKDIESYNETHKASDEEDSEDLKYNVWNKSRLLKQGDVTPKYILELDFNLLTSNRPAKLENATNQLAAAVQSANDNKSKDNHEREPPKKKKILRFNVETEIVQGRDHDINSISGGSLSRMSSATDLLSSPTKSPNLGRMLSVENLFSNQVSRQSSAMSDAGGWMPASDAVWEGSDELVEQWWAQHL